MPNGWLQPAAKDRAGAKKPDRLADVILLNKSTGDADELGEVEARIRASPLCRLHKTEPARSRCRRFWAQCLRLDRPEIDPISRRRPPPQ